MGKLAQHSKARRQQTQGGRCGGDGPKDMTLTWGDLHDHVWRSGEVSRGRSSGCCCNRLRYCIWKDWKKPERKRKNLIRLGVDQHHAYAWSRTRKGGWAIAQSPILSTTITLNRLAKRGYEALLDHYRKVAPHLNEPLYTRPVRTVV